MFKISILNRIIFLLNGHLSGYMIVKGMEPYSELTILYFTIAFGTLLLSSLLLMILGFEVLKNKSIILISFLIPAGLSLGLINQYYQGFHIPYLVLYIVCFVLIIISQYYMVKRKAIIITAIAHGLSGITLTILPLLLVINKVEGMYIMSISVGGIVLGLTGLLQTLLKTGKIKISEWRLYEFFPSILFFATVFFVIGLRL